jgi:Lar family restriction alleviation protein
MTMLKNCPFCASEARVARGEHSFFDVKIRCTSCGAEGPLFDVDCATSSFANERAATEHWNTRKGEG